MLARSDAPAVGSSADRNSLASASIPIVVAALGVVVVGQGGFYPPVQLVVTIALATAALLALMGGVTVDASLAPPAYLAAALSTWAVARSSIGGDPASGVAMAMLVAGIAVVVAVFSTADVEDRRLLGHVLVALGVGVAATGWVGMAFHLRPWAMTATSTWRASSVITYPNATAALLVLILLPVVAERASARRSVVTGLVVWAHLVGIGAAQSRGGMVALAAGVAVVAAIIGARRTIVALGGPLVGAAATLASLVPGAHHDVAARPALAVAGALIGMAIVAVDVRIPERMSAAAGVVLVGGGSCLAVVMGAMGLLRGDRFRFGSPEREQANDLAIEAIRRNPVGGVGPGDLDLIWHTPDAVQSLQYVHNEYLELTAELGLIGLAFLATSALLVVRSMRRARSSADTARWVGGAAGLAAFGVHSAFDFLWHVPAVPLVAASVLGLAIAPSSDRTIEASDLQPQPTSEEDQS